MNEFEVFTQKGRKAERIFVRCPSPDIWKTRAARLVEALHGRWSGRFRAYEVSKRALKRFEELYLLGWDANGFTNQLKAPEEEHK